MSQKLTTKGEELATRLFKEKYFLDLEKIQEQGNPDFFVLKGGKKIAACEVKDIENDELCAKNNSIYDSEYSLWSQEDNMPDKIRKKIYKGRKQLKNHALPKILCFVDYSEDPRNILRQAITGLLPYKYHQTGKILQVFDGGKVSLSRIKPILKKIDLYILINPKNEEFSGGFFDTTKGPKLVEQYFSDNNK